MDGLFSLLERFTDAIVAVAERLGAGGLALVAFFDSSFLSLPQVTDALTIALTLKNPSNWILHGLSATVGSLCGCLALFLVARKGGEAFLRRRLKQGHIDSGLRLFQRHGWLTIAVPAIMPPPAPFKLFVLLAGVANIRVWTFLAAAAVGRAFRYGGEAWLTYRYGNAATGFIRENLPTVSLVVAGVVLVAGVALVLWRRRGEAVA